MDAAAVAEVLAMFDTLVAELSAAEVPAPTNAGHDATSAKPTASTRVPNPQPAVPFASVPRTDTQSLTVQGAPARRHNADAPTPQDQETEEPDSQADPLVVASPISPIAAEITTRPPVHAPVTFRATFINNEPDATSETETPTEQPVRTERSAAAKVDDGEAARPYTAIHLTTALAQPVTEDQPVEVQIHPQAGIEPRQEPPANPQARPHETQTTQTATIPTFEKAARSLSGSPAHIPAPAVARAMPHTAGPADDSAVADLPELARAAAPALPGRADRASDPVQPFVPALPALPEQAAIEEPRAAMTSPAFAVAALTSAAAEKPAPKLTDAPAEKVSRNIAPDTKASLPSTDAVIARPVTPLTEMPRERATYDRPIHVPASVVGALYGAMPQHLKTAAFDEPVRAAQLMSDVTPLPAATADQIVQSLRIALTRDGGEARITLNPREFGDLTVSVKVEQGAVVARVQTDTPAVREWLNANQDTLRTRLADQELRLDRLEVAAPEESAESRRDPESRGHDEHPHDRHKPRRNPSSATFEVLA